MTDSKEVSVFGGDVEAALRSLQSFSQTLSTATDKPFARFHKDGTWTYGPETIVIEADELWAIDPASLRHGWIGWSEGRVAGEHMVPFNEPKLPESQLEPIKKVSDSDGWQEQVTVDLQRLSDNVEILFKTSSLGGRGAVSRLIETEMLPHLRDNPATPYPVCHLKSDSYKHSNYGKIFFPVFEVADWVDRTGRSEKEQRKLV